MVNVLRPFGQTACSKIPISLAILPLWVRLVGSGFSNVGTTQKADDAGASVRACDNGDLRKLREGQRDKISITALAAKRVYTGADIGAGVANTLRPARSTTAFEGAAVIMEIGRAPLSLSVTLMR